MYGEESFAYFMTYMGMGNLLRSRYAYGGIFYLFLGDEKVANQ